MARKHVIVLMGGASSEHEVSLASGANVIEIRVSQKLTAAQRETFRDALQKLIDSGDLALNV